MILLINYLNFPFAKIQIFEFSVNKKQKYNIKNRQIKIIESQRIIFIFA